MLPTEKENNINLSDMGNLQPLFDNASKNVNNHFKGKNQHLYLVSDREIKEGDWYYDPINELVDNNYNLNSNGNKKIEATTDTSLKVARDEFTPSLRHPSMDYKTLPQIPQSFIEAYVKAEGDIKEVNIEMEYLDKGWNENVLNRVFEIKTNSDNTVTIEIIK